MAIDSQFNLPSPENPPSMTSDTSASGLTAFAPPPAPTYRFEVSSKAAKLSIWLENTQSKKQWCTGLLDENEYVKSTNHIADISVGDYVSLFNDTLRYLMGDPSESKGVSDKVEIDKIRRQLSELEEEGLKLELSVKIRVLESAWTAKYIFQLTPVSLERIDIVEAKLRDVQEKLANTKISLEEEKAKTKRNETVYLQAISDNIEKLNDKGQIIWNGETHKNFQLTSERSGILVLVSGCYVLNLKVYLDPQSGGGKVQLLKNGSEAQCSQIPQSARTSAALGISMFLKEEDKLEVILTKSPQYVGANLTLVKVGE